jgi:hypothetical protein
MTAQNQLIFDKLVCDLHPCKEMLFYHKQIKKKLIFILQLAAEIFS